MRRGEDLNFAESAGLYLELGTALEKQHQEVKRTLEKIENSGTRVTTLRKLADLTSEAIDRRLKQAIH